MVRDLVPHKAAWLPGYKAASLHVPALSFCGCIRLRGVDSHNLTDVIEWR